MVNLQKSGDSAVKFVFTDSDHYLYGNGEIEVPVNSLLLVIDESEMVTFKKLSGDPFLSFRADNSNLGTKAAIEQFYKDNMVGSTGGGSESGITSGEVQTMIDNSLEDYYTDDEVDAALSGKASASDVTAVANDVSTLSGQVATKVAISDFNAYSAATDARIAEDEEVTAAALNDLDENKADTSALDDYYEKVSGLTIEFNEEYQTPKIFLEKESEGIRYENIMNDAGFDSYQEMEDGSSYDTNFGYGTIGQTAFDQPESGISSNREFQITTDGFNQMTENSDDNEGYSPYRSESEFNYETGLEMNNTWTEPDQENVGEFIESSSRVTINSQKNPFIELTDVEGNVTRINTTGITINDGQTIATEPYVDAALSGKADTSAVTAVANDVTVLSGAVDDTKAYYISFATLATQGITDNDWDGIVAAIDAHRPIYAGYPKQDGGIIYYGVECMNKNVSNTEIVMTASDNSAHYFYTFTKNGSNDYSYTVSTKPYVPDITTSITSGSTDAQVPSAKATYDAIQAGGGGMDDDTQQLISTAFNDLNDRKADLTELSKYQIKGNYALTSTLADYMTNDAFDEYATAKEKIISGALNDLNDKFGGLKLVKISQTDYDNLATKDGNTLYIINNVI